MLFVLAYLAFCSVCVATYTYVASSMDGGMEKLSFPKVYLG